MKNKMKLGMCCAILMGGLAYGTLGTGDLVAYASSHDVNTKAAQPEENQSNVDYTVFVASLAKSKFKDVRADHYSYDAINWAQSKGIVDGYGDGRFGPNNDVTEAQFAKMVSEFFNLKGNGKKLVKNQVKSLWSDPYYDRLAAHGVPMNGYLDNVIRNKVVKRGTVAQTLAYLGGYSMDLEDSINFLLDNKVTVGQNSAHKNDLFKYFGTQNDLSRAQVVTFLNRMNNNGLSKVGVNANDIFKNDSGYTLNQTAAIGKNKIDKSLAQGGTVNSPGTTVPNKPTTPSYSMPVVEGAKNIDKATVDYYSKRISAPVKKLIFDDKNLKVSDAESLGDLKSITFTSPGKILIFNIDSTEESISYNYVDEEVAIALINQLYGTKFKENELNNAANGKMGGKFSKMSFNTNKGAMIMIKK